MARVTVEDCLEETGNRFALVHVASKRTKALLRGARPVHPCKNREVVTALREIADLKVHPVLPDQQSEDSKES